MQLSCAARGVRPSAERRHLARVLEKVARAVPRLKALRELSVAFIGAAESASVNGRMRGKKKPADVLSFDLGGGTGEILLCPPAIKQRTRVTARSVRDETLFLFVHALLHLAGYGHATTAAAAEMERLEQRLFDDLS